MTLADVSEDTTDPRVDETTALLALSANVPAAQGNVEEGDSANGHADDDKPLPKDQIFFLCFARLVEPLAFFCIFPFLNQMIWETGQVAKTDVGFYSGLIVSPMPSDSSTPSDQLFTMYQESLFSLTQMSLMIPWGRAADYWGRKPVLVASLSGVAVATAVFGLSRTIWQMILLRCFAGIFAGTIV